MTRKREIEIRGVRYDSMAHAAESLGVSTAAVSRAQSEGRLDRVGLSCASVSVLGQSCTLRREHREWLERNCPHGMSIAEFIVEGVLDDAVSGE